MCFHEQSLVSAEYFEHHGDYTLIKPKFWKRFRNGGRQRRLVNVFFSRWENGTIPYSISQVYNGELLQEYDNYFIKISFRLQRLR